MFFLTSKTLHGRVHNTSCPAPKRWVITAENMRIKFQTVRKCISEANHINRILSMKSGRAKVFPYSQTKEDLQDRDEEYRRVRKGGYTLWDAETGSGVSLQTLGWCLRYGPQEGLGIKQRSSFLTPPPPPPPHTLSLQHCCVTISKHPLHSQYTCP